jgi:hypothetical protein
MSCTDRLERRRGLLRSESGAAYVEFVLVFPILFLFFTSILQLCLLYAASLLTEHAAERAARAASVVLDDDATYYDGDARGDAFGESASPIDLERYYARDIGSAGAAGSSGAARPISRRGTIELAAMIPLLALSRRPPGTLRAAAEYAVTHTRVVITPPAQTGLEDGSGEVEVTVSFDLPCAFPMGGRLVCHGTSRTVAATARRTVHRARYPYR